MISEDQHGARSGRSTLTQLLDQHDQILDALSQGKNMDIIYLDFAKAFDLVDVSILLSQIKKMGIKGKLLSWITTFLNNRTHKVRINDVLSKER